MASNETDTPDPSPDPSKDGQTDSGAEAARPMGQPQTIDLDPADVSDNTEPEAAADDDTTDTPSDKADSALNAAAPPPRASATGFMSAALGGGIVGAALVYGLVFFGLIPGTRPVEDGADLAALNAVRQSVAEIKSSVDPGAIDARIAALQDQIASLGGATPDTGAVDALAERVAALENMPATDGDMAGRLDAMEAQTTQIATSVDGLKTDLDGLSSAIPAETADVDLSGIEARLDALETGTREAITTAIAAIPAPDLSGMEATQTELLADVTALTARADKLDKSVQTLSLDLNAIRSSTAALNVERQAAYLVALSGLQRASAGSGPFVTELNAVKSLSDNETVFDDLTGFAEKGVPSTPDLAAVFSGLTGTILDEAAKDSANGVFGRLAAGAQSLVRVRPTGYVAGGTPAAIVARIEALLADGKLAAALKEWDALPVAGQAASADWAAKARDRLALDTALAGSPKTN